MTANRPARPAPFTPEDVGAFVRAATAAPSVHNSQPWRFRDREDRIELHLDPSRPLAVADPDDRERVISCGAALFNLRLAMAHLGYQPIISLLPGPHHLATITRGPSQPLDPALEGLYDAIHRRRSYRRPFASTAVPEVILGELAHAAEAEGAVLDRIGTRAGQTMVVGLSIAAARSLLSDPAYRRELAHWTRHARPAPDGVELAALGREPYPVSGLPWALVTDSAAGAGESHAGEMLVLGTPGDSAADWLRAGQGLQRVLLTATARGLVVSLFTQLAEVDATRRALVRDLELHGLPQVVLRLGHPARGDVPSSARRRVTTAFLPD